jgi:mRNA-degrading endonuclease HigB of HigAB toxin-antitoxin module
LADRVLLAPRNDTATELNKTLLDLMPFQLNSFKVVWTHRTAHFQQNIRSYNNAVSSPLVAQNLILLFAMPSMHKDYIPFKFNVFRVDHHFGVLFVAGHLYQMTVVIGYKQYTKVMIRHK